MCRLSELVDSLRAGYFTAIFHFQSVPLGFPMDYKDMLGLPDIVYHLLCSESMDRECKLEYNINGIGENMELTLRWSKRGSKWEQPFSDRSTKYKSPAAANRRRDNNRKKQQNVERNSKSVGTNDHQDIHMSDKNNFHDIDQPTCVTPISASKNKKCQSKITIISTKTKAHMTLRSQSAIEEKRDASMDSYGDSIFSPISVEISPVSMTMDERLGHQLTTYHSQDSINNINNGPPDHSKISDHEDYSDSISGESMDYIDSDCATDFEDNTLGECGLSACEYGPSVDYHDVHLPSHMLKCENCGWVVCRDCYHKGGINVIKDTCNS